MKKKKFLEFNENEGTADSKLKGRKESSAKRNVHMQHRALS